MTRMHSCSFAFLMTRASIVADILSGQLLLSVRHPIIKASPVAILIQINVHRGVPTSLYPVAPNADDRTDGPMSVICIVMCAENTLGVQFSGAAMTSVTTTH